MTDKQYRGEFISYFLRTVLGREVKIKSVTAQSIATPGSREKRGIRMDVETEALLPKRKAGLEEEQIAADRRITADIEMQAHDKEVREGQKYDLRKRSRLYQGLLDVNMLQPSMNYGELGHVLIIICTPYDLFGRDRLKYTFEHTCLEEPGLCLKDGARRIFLNTGGSVGTDELKKLLRYIAKSTAENAANDQLKDIHKMVTAVKEAKERREEYMWAFERDAMLRDEGREEGIIVGKKKGKKVGKKVGKKAGMKRVNRLIWALIATSREAEIEESVNNPEYQEKLFREFGI